MDAARTPWNASWVIYLNRSGFSIRSIGHAYLDPPTVPNFSLFGQFYRWKSIHLTPLEDPGMSYVIEIGYQMSFSRSFGATWLRLPVVAWRRPKARPARPGRPNGWTRLGLDGSMVALGLLVMPGHRGHWHERHERGMDFFIDSVTQSRKMWVCLQ